jgi:hypothetical protein
VKFPADPLRQPSIVWFALSEELEVWVVCVVVVVVELVSGVWLDGEVLEGEVLDGEVVCGYPLLGVVDWEPEVEGDVLLGACEPDDDEPVWATTQTVDSSRMAVIRYPFLIEILLVLSAFLLLAAFSIWKWRHFV